MTDTASSSAFDIADRIVAEIRPQRVLDAGCGFGLLVEALRERDVERGFYRDVDFDASFITPARRIGGRLLRPFR